MPVRNVAILGCDLFLGLGVLGFGSRWGGFCGGLRFGWIRFWIAGWIYWFLDLFLDGVLGVLAGCFGVGVWYFLLCLHGGMIYAIANLLVWWEGVVGEEVVAADSRA